MSFNFAYLYKFIFQTPMPIVAIKCVFLGASLLYSIPIFNMFQNMDAPIVSFYAVGTILSIGSAFSDLLIGRANLDSVIESIVFERPIR